MPSAIEDSPSLHDALELLHNASRTPPKQRAVRVSSVVDVICRHAFENGLDNDALRTVIQLASVKTHLDQTSLTTLIKNLYPAQRVPNDVIVTVVGALGQGKGKPSPGTQECLVKWLTIVHEIIQDSGVLSRLYGVLFSMLDMISIRTSLCHLLSLITRRKHVKPFRIQQILELSRGLNNEPALQGLLRVFKDYYPDIIIGSTSTTRKSFAPQPDAEWRARISRIQEASITADESAPGVNHGFKVLRKRSKRSKVSAIPDVHTFHASENSVTLEGIDNVEDFVEKLDRIDPPGQLISFLTDPLLQKYVELRPSPISSSRIDLWLGTCLEGLYEDERLGTIDRQYMDEILEGLLQHAQHIKGLSRSTISFLKDYVQIWDGEHHTDALLELLSFIPIDSFDDAYITFFKPVELVLARHGLPAYGKLVDFYTALLQRQVCSTILNESPRDTSTQTLTMLTEHISTLVVSILLSMPSSDVDPTLLSPILSFYEQLATSSKPHFVSIILPPMYLVYLLAQQPSPAAFSRLCGIIGSYKSAFDQHPRPVKDYYPAHVTDSLNWCLRDIYNLIWVSRGLVSVDKKAVGFYCDPSLRLKLNAYLSSIEREYAIGTAFSLSNYAWMASLSAVAWRSIEEQQIKAENFDRDSIRYHQGPVSQRSLDVLKREGGVSVDWDGPQGFKVHVLNWLAHRGMSGVRDLMFATVTDLRGKV